MNGIALFNALTKIDDRFIDRAERGPDAADRRDVVISSSRRTDSRRSVRRWAIVAECACLLLCVSALVFGIGIRQRRNAGGINRSAISSDYVAAATSAAAADVSPATQAWWSQAGTEGTAATHELNTRFTLSTVGGRVYLNFDEGNDPIDPHFGCLDFPSLDALVAAIRANDLFDVQCETIRTIFPRDENGIRIIDVDHVCDPLLPDDLFVGCVDWEGPSYAFEFDGRNVVSGILRVLTKEDYATVFADEYETFFDRETITVLSRENVAERNAEVVRYRTSTGEDYQAIRYALANGVKVVEFYRVQKGTPLAIPEKVALYGESGDAAFQAQLYDLTERPSVEWLSQFGLAAR